MYVKPQLASKINLTPHPSKKSKQTENKYKNPFYTWITLLGEKQTFLKKIILFWERERNGLLIYIQQAIVFK